MYVAVCKVLHLTTSGVGVLIAKLAGPATFKESGVVVLVVDLGHLTRDEWDHGISFSMVLAWGG